jgi:hypothetical protein
MRVEAVIRPFSLALLALAALALAGCSTTGSAESPRDGRAGVQMSGRLATTGSVAVSDGRPELLEGDCERVTGVPADICFVTRGIGGTIYVLGFGNLDGLPRGERVEVTSRPCTSADACAQVTDGAVVLLAVDGDLHRPDAGTLLLRRAERDERYVGRLQLSVDSGRVSADFDVVPRPPAPSAPEEPPQGEPFTPDEVEPYDPEA